MQRELIVAGALVQFAGIILVASPDLFPTATRLSRSLWRLFKRPAPDPWANLQLDRWFEFGNSATKKPSAGAELAEQVGFLLRRDEELRTFEQETGKTFFGLDKALREFSEGRAKAMFERYLPLRILGVIFLIVGLGLTVAASFVV